MAYAIEVRNRETGEWETSEVIGALSRRKAIKGNKTIDTYKRTGKVQYRVVKTG